MMDGPPSPDTYRMIGAIAGATSGLLFLWPKTIREAAARFAFSVIFGFGFYFVPIQLLKWADVNGIPYHDLIMGGSLLTGFASWPLAGVVIKKVGAKLSA